ncbi:hypothetical protein NW762_009158 [Fusarium torreyae]|uniref:DUF8035 domain-containing protein n=1 Tax=Fusarium torreyae TaxID=1237075 RepID=A0A9W8RXL5_9HYPO|nr:hypothetical protein NW762_009158 [Fusarium torreyae]
MSHTSERVGIGCTPPESAYSTSTGSSSSTSSVRSAYPKKGKTRIPSKLVSRQAILDLGYPFFEEGNTIIIQQALGQDNIDELLKASENYKKAELETHEARNPARDTVRKIPLDTDKDGSGTMGNDIPFPPLSNNLRDDQNVPSGTSGSMMRPWINQVLTSGFLRLSNNRKQEEIQSTNPVASDVHQAWVSPQAILEDGTLSSNLFNIHAAEYYQGEIGTHRTTLLCPDRPYISGEGASSVKMRWL